MSKAVIAKDLRVLINGEEVLANISLEVDVGEVLCVTGPTGSGKSTLLKVIAGIIPKLYPSFKVVGYVRVFGLDPQEAVREGLVAYVPQDPSSYFIGSTVSEEISFTSGLGGNYGIDKIVGDLLDNRARSIHELSDGQLYRLLLATAVSSGTKLLLLDEPTSHVDPWCLREVLKLVRDYCLSYGASAIIVDHRVRLVKDFVDRVIQLNSNHLSNANAELPVITAEGSSYDTNVLVSAENLSFTYDGVHYVVNGVDFEVRSGESVVFIGRNGAGKTTLIKLLARLLKPTKGKVFTTEPVFMIPQTPVYWFSQDTVRGEVELYARLWGFRGSVREVLERFYLSRVSSLSPYSLSVGEARRLSLALAYVSGAKVLLLDEPTLGLDPTSKTLLIKVIHTFLKVGSAVVIATHDLDMVKYFSRVYILREGTTEVMGDVPTLVA